MSKALIPKTSQWWNYRRIRCNCGHYPKDHYNGEGWCEKCGCTWYYPNDKYVARKNRCTSDSQVQDTV